MNGLSKGAVDRLGKRLRDAELPDPSDVSAYIEWSATFEDPLRETLVILDAAARRAGVSLDEKTSRIKQLYSVVAKLHRGHHRLSSIDDIAGCRAVVQREVDINALVLQLATSNVKRVRDYRNNDRNGYRAVHITILDEDGRAVEIQLRTELQHVWAGLCERRAAVVDHAVKYGGGPQEERENLTELSRFGRWLDLWQVEHQARYERVRIGQEQGDMPREAMEPTWAALDEEKRDLDAHVRRFVEICERYVVTGRLT